MQHHSPGYNTLLKPMQHQHFFNILLILYFFFPPPEIFTPEFIPSLYANGIQIKFILISSPTDYFSPTNAF